MLSYAEGSVETMRGKFSVKYERNGDKINAAIKADCKAPVTFISGKTELAIKNGENHITF